MNSPDALLDRGSPLRTRGYGNAWTWDTLRLALGPILVMAVLGGCTGSDAVPTGPGERPLLDESSAAAFSATLNPTGNRQDVGPMTLGSYTYPTLVVTEVRGLLERYYADIPYFGENAGTFIDQWDAAGLWTDFDGCTGNVWVYSATGGRIFCDAGNHDAPKSWADTSVMQGTVTALWHAGPPGWGFYCGDGPCFTYTGSHAVAVTPVSASLGLKPSRYVTYFALPPVTFTAQVSPTQVGGHDVPFSVQSWTWVADTGSGNLPSCGTAKICAFSPSSSGTMRVTAIVNGVIMNKSVHIRVLCWSTGDSLLDSLPILDAMDSAWKASKATGPMGDRRERSWTVECTPLGECTWDVAIQPDDAPCHSTRPPDDPTGVRVAQGHTHPFNPNGFPNAEWIPVGLCPEEAPRGGYPHPGPSWHDASLIAGKPVQNYILDGELIHALPTNASVADILSDPKKIPRKDGHGCTRP